MIDFLIMKKLKNSQEIFGKFGKSLEIIAGHKTPNFENFHKFFLKMQ